MNNISKNNVGVSQEHTQMTTKCGPLNLEI